jgi:hypothetical protein
VYAPVGAIVLLSALQGTAESPSLNNSSTKRTNELIAGPSQNEPKVIQLTYVF